MNSRRLRLDRLLSGATGLSRRLAHQAIRDAEVRVDGVLSTDPGTRVGAAARIEYRGEVIDALRSQYWMLHKPVGVVCAARDAAYRTVLDCMDVAPRVALHVAGRLDVDATGLVLLTNDGDWSHRVTAPRYLVAKIYRVTLADPLGEGDVDLLRRGVVLKGEARACQPATLNKISDGEWHITITEGKYHQVKRMFAAINNHVIALHRERIGAVTLDPALAPGGSRPLTAEEIAGFYRNG